MAEVKVEGPELKKLVKLSKKKPLAFAFSPGKKPDEHIMAIDRRKSGSFLGKAAKKESTGMKVAYGTCALDGKVLKMTCEQVVPTMAKTVKKYLKTQNIKVNIEILDIEGNSLESDIEDLPDDPSMMDDDDLVADGENTEEPQAEAAAAEEPQDTQAQTGEENAQAEDGGNDLDEAERRKKLAERLKGTQHDVMGTDGPAGETLKKVMAAAVSMLKSGDLDKAEETIVKLEGALAKIGAAAPAPETPQETQSNGPDAVGLAGRAQALKQQIEAVAEPAKTKLMTALGAAAKAIKGGQLPQAEGALNKIEAALEKVTAAPATPETSPEAEAAEKRLADLQSATGDVVDEATQTKLLAALGKAANEIKAASFDAAGKMMDTIENAIKNATPQATDADPLAAKWADESARVKAAIQKAIDDGKGDLSAMNRAFDYAVQLAADGNDYQGALNTLERMQKLFDAAATMTGTAAATEAADAAADNVVGYTASRHEWIKTRESLTKQMTDLQREINKVTADVEGLEDVPAKSGILFDYLKPLDNELEKILEALVETPDGAERETLKKNARDSIAKYQAALDTDFFKNVDQNGFVGTSIRESAIKSLQNVSTALAA